MPMRALTTILWLQVLLGCIAAVLSWRPMFAGAMGTEWISGLKKDLAAIQQSTDYREPPKIRSLSSSDIIDRLQASTYESMHLRGLLFLSSTRCCHRGHGRVVVGASYEGEHFDQNT